MKKFLTNPFVILVLLVFVIFFMSRKADVQPKDAPQKAAIEMPVSSLPTEIDATPVAPPPEQLQADLDRARAITAQNEELGLQTIAGKEEGGELVLGFEFKGQKKWCQPGDLDTMKHAVSDNNGSEILISLEAMDSDNQAGFYTSVNALKGGMVHDFRIKNSGSSYGLYICLDKRQENRCKKKRLVDQAVMNSELADLKTEPDAKDFIFYYQPLVLYKNGLSAYRTDKFSVPFQASVKKVMTEQFHLASRDFNAAWDISNVTRSLPMTTRNNKMVVELTYNDPRCSD